MKSPALKGSETISKRSPYILICMGAVKPRSLILAQLSDAIRTLSNRFSSRWRHDLLPARIRPSFADGLFSAADPSLNFAGYLLCFP